MPDREALVEELAGDENRYLLVRPSGGLRGGYEVVNVWNGDIKWRFQNHEEAVEKAEWYLERTDSFDHVLVVR